MLLLVFLCVIILMLSFAASSVEAALFSVSSIRIEQMCEKKLPGAARLRKNKENIQDSIIALVILNNLANITGSILVGGLAGEMFRDLWLGVFTGAFTFVIIITGEILPKTVGERYADSYARHTASMVWLLRMIFLPLVFLLRFVVKPIGGSTEARDRVSEDEITLLAHLGHRHGAILESENRLIRHVFQLNDILARDIMTPRTVVIAMPADRRLDEAAQELYKTSVSRIPVYEDDLDSVLGIVYIRDLLAGLAKGQGARTLREYMDEAMFVPDTVHADILLTSFQKNRSHLAIVVDEFGGTAGIITLEDILEQLVGEIVDEYDKDVDMRVKAKAKRERRALDRRQ